MKLKESNVKRTCLLSNELSKDCHSVNIEHIMLGQNLVRRLPLDGTVINQNIA